MGFAVEAVAYGWMAVAGLLTQTGTIFVVDAPTNYLRASGHDQVQMIVSTWERAEATRTGTNSWDVDPQIEIREWYSNDYSVLITQVVGGVTSVIPTLYTNVVTNTFGWRSDYAMMTNADAKMRDAVPYFAKTSSYEGEISFDMLSITGQFADLEIGNLTNLFTQTPCFTNNVGETNETTNAATYGAWARRWHVIPMRERYKLAYSLEKTAPTANRPWTNEYYGVGSGTNAADAYTAASADFGSRTPGAVFQQVCTKSFWSNYVDYTKDPAGSNLEDYIIDTYLEVVTSSNVYDWGTNIVVTSSNSPVMFTNFVVTEYPEMSTNVAGTQTNLSVTGTLDPDITGTDYIRGDDYDGYPEWHNPGGVRFIYNSYRTNYIITGLGPRAWIHIGDQYEVTGTYVPYSGVSGTATVSYITVTNYVLATNFSWPAVTGIYSNEFPDGGVPKWVNLTNASYIYFSEESEEHRSLFPEEGGGVYVSVNAGPLGVYNPDNTNWGRIEVAANDTYEITFTNDCGGVYVYQGMDGLGYDWWDCATNGKSIIFDTGSVVYAIDFSSTSSPHWFNGDIPPVGTWTPLAMYGNATEATWGDVVTQDGTNNPNGTYWTDTKLAYSQALWERDDHAWWAIYNGGTYYLTQDTNALSPAWSVVSEQAGAYASGIDYTTLVGSGVYGYAKATYYNDMGQHYVEWYATNTWTNAGTPTQIFYQCWLTRTTCSNDAFASTSIEHQVSYFGYMQAPDAGDVNTFTNEGAGSFSENQWTGIGTSVWTWATNAPAEFGSAGSNPPVDNVATPTVNQTISDGFRMTDVKALTDWIFMYATNKFW